MRSTVADSGSAARLARIPASVRRVHLIGVGGTAMAALAGMLAERGFRVTGSDRQLYEPTASLLVADRVDDGFRPRTSRPRPTWSWSATSITRDNPEAAGAARKRDPVSLDARGAVAFLPAATSAS